MADKLTTKQELFVNYYLGEAQHNATEAARLAGYKKPNVQGSQNLVKLSISSRIREKLDKACLTADRVLSRLSTIADFDVSNYMVRGKRIIRNPRTGERVDEEECWEVDINAIKADGFGFVIKGPTFVDGTEVIQFHDAHGGLRDVGRYHKLFTDKTELSGKVDGPVVILKGVSMDEL